MLLKEFTDRVGFEVDANVYHSFIEPDYNDSKEDKDTWCHNWLKKQSTKAGIQANLALLSTYIASAKALHDAGQNLENINKDLHTQLAKAKDELKAKQAELSTLQNNYEGFKNSWKSLVKENLRYKVMLGLPLTDQERENIADFLK